MTDSSGAIKVRVPKYRMEADFSPPPPGALNGGAPPSVGHPGSPEYRQANPDGAKDAPRTSESDSLIAAIAKVHRAATAKIAWHEAELKKLRAALAPFGAMSPARHNDAPEDEAGGNALRALLALADKLPQDGESQS